MGGGYNLNIVRQADIGMLSNPNILINGGFEVAQKGTELKKSEQEDAHVLDMWQTGWQAAHYQRVENTSPASVKYAMRVTCTNLLSRMILLQMTECLEIYEGQVVTLSAWIRGTVGHIGLGAFNQGGPVKAVSENWQQIVFTLQVAKENQSNVILAIDVGDPQVVQMGDWYEIAAPKLEFGEIATAYVPENYAETLAKCQRYYIDLKGNITHHNNIAFAVGYNATTIVVHFPLSVTMRTHPTLICDLSKVQFYTVTPGAGHIVGAEAVSGYMSAGEYIAAFTVTGAIQGALYDFRMIDDSQLALSAEL